MSGLKIGLCSVTFRKKTVCEVVEIAKSAGVSYVEWGGDVHVVTLEDAQNAKKLCDASGIKISSYGSYFNCIDYDEKSWRQVCAIAKEMDARSVRVWLGRKDSEKTNADEYVKLLENTKKMCDIAAEYDVSVAPECHDNTFNDNTQAILKFISELNRDNFRTYFQSRYFREEYDMDRIDKTFDYIKDVHVSFRDLKKEQRFRKKDKRYLEKLIKKLKEKSFAGIVMVEFVSGDKEKVFRKDAEKLRIYWGE